MYSWNEWQFSGFRGPTSGTAARSPPCLSPLLESVQERESLSCWQTNRILLLWGKYILPLEYMHPSCWRGGGLLLGPKEQRCSWNGKGGNWHIFHEEQRYQRTVGGSTAVWPQEHVLGTEDEGALTRWGGPCTEILTPVYSVLWVDSQRKVTLKSYFLNK